MVGDKVTVVYRTRNRRRPEETKRNHTWKVAYADFITAMMAFFMMLWLLSITPQNKLQGIAQYFTLEKPHTDNSNTPKENPIDDSAVNRTEASSSLIYGSASRARRINQSDNNGLMSDIEKQHFMDIMNNIQKSVELKEYMENISIDVTADGLRIQIMDSDNRPIFKPDTSELQPYMGKILTVIARMIKDQPNFIAFSGHTASIKDNATQQEKSSDKWLLSAERANEIRKFLVKNSIKDERIGWITGKSDKEPFDPKDKYSLKNIRVSVTLLNDSAVSHFRKSAPSDIKAK